MPSGSSISIWTSPQGSVARSRTTFRTCIQIINERPGAPDAFPETPEQSLAEEENRPRMVRKARFPVDGQAQDVAAEAEAAVRVAGAHKDPAA
jgi:hypothetical protein